MWIISKLHYHKLRNKFSFYVKLTQFLTLKKTFACDEIGHDVNTTASREISRFYASNSVFAHMHPMPDLGFETGTHIFVLYDLLIHYITCMREFYFMYTYLVKTWNCFTISISFGLECPSRYSCCWQSDRVSVLFPNSSFVALIFLPVKIWVFLWLLETYSVFKKKPKKPGVLYMTSSTDVKYK